MPDAVLLDMDGTIVDSSAAVERAWAAFAADHGLDPAIVLATCHGNATKTTIRVHLPAADEATVDKIAAVHLAREVGDVAGIGPIEGARELIVLLESHGVPWAVVTHSPPTPAAARLGAAGFDPPVLVTAGDVDHPKPAPDGYELAAARCGGTPQRCLVLEDSEAGIRAGQDAGAEVITVGTAGLTLAEVATELLSRLG